MQRMYLDALSFLEDERDTWRPFEALDSLSDDQLSIPVPGAHGWSGRDLMGHLLGWLEISLAAAKELAVNETSRTLTEMNARWDADGEAVNTEMLERYRGMPLAELRERFRIVPGELRGYLTVVPESRWIKHPTHQASFVEETLEHYEEHAADLQAILEAVR
jgi:hypothetical protein